MPPAFLWLYGQVGDFTRDGKTLSAVSEMMDYIRGEGYVCKEGDGRLFDSGTCCNDSGYCRTINVYMKKNDENESEDITLDQARAFIAQIRDKDKDNSFEIRENDANFSYSVIAPKCNRGGEKRVGLDGTVYGTDDGTILNLSCGVIGNGLIAVKMAGGRQRKSRSRSRSRKTGTYVKQDRTVQVKQNGRVVTKAVYKHSITGELRHRKMVPGRDGSRHASYVKLPVPRKTRR